MTVSIPNKPYVSQNIIIFLNLNFLEITPLNIYTTSYQFIDIKKLICIFDIKNVILTKSNNWNLNC